MKYRIIEQKTLYSTTYLIQEHRQFLWWKWWRYILLHHPDFYMYLEFDTVEEAKDWIRSEEYGVKSMVVG